MPNPDYPAPTVIGGALGGRSAVIDYKGHVLASNQIVDDCYVAAEVNIEALRHYRQDGEVPELDALPALRDLQGSAREPVWPKNLPNMKHEDAEVVFREAVDKLTRRGTFTKKSN